MGAVDVLRGLAKPGRLQFLYVDLGDSKAVSLDWSSLVSVGECCSLLLKFW